MSVRVVGGVLVATTFGQRSVAGPGVSWTDPVVASGTPVTVTRWAGALVVAGLGAVAWHCVVFVHVAPAGDPPVGVTGFDGPDGALRPAPFDANTEHV